MGRVFGANVLAAVHAGFRAGGDYRAVVPLLAARGVSAAADLPAGAARADASRLLEAVFGEEMFAAVNGSGCGDGDYRAVLPLLSGAAAANQRVRSAAQAAFKNACAAGEAGVAGLCLVHAGVDGDRRLPEDSDELWYHGGHSGCGVGTALAAAAQRGDAGMVRALIASGRVDVNASANYRGSRALLLACNQEGGHAECVAALLAAPEIDVNHTDDGNSTALAAAADNGYTDIVRALSAVGGIDANHLDDNDCTALMYAAKSGHTSCARALVAIKDISINMKYVDCVAHSSHNGGFTALHDACVDLRGATRTEMVELLLTAGGCRFQLDDAGKTPLDLAAGDRGVAKVFAAGVDYWQLRLHGGHGWAMKEVARTLLLIDQRLDADAALLAPHLPVVLPYLPKEVWLVALGFLRSADFMP